MAKVEIDVNGRAYQVTCEDGQESRLRDLAAYLDRHVAELVETLGQIGEARLLLLAGLTHCDELFEARCRIRVLEDGAPALDAATLDGAREAVDAARRRVARITERLEAAG